MQAKDCLGIQNDWHTTSRDSILIFSIIANFRKLLGRKFHIGRSISLRTQKLDFKFIANSRNYKESIPM